MSRASEAKPSRRSFLTGAAGLAGATGLTGAGTLQATMPRAATAIEPFWGAHQSGIVTATQLNTYFAAFDLQASTRSEIAGLMRAWTEAAAAMTQAPAGSETLAGLGKHRLTITFGFGPGLFVKDGHDRYGLAARRPEPLIDLPRFNGDQLVEARTGGDLSVQACADDAQTAFMAVRQLARLADGIAGLRWCQAGFSAAGPTGETPRNLMGFKDGTMNPLLSDARLMDNVVWAGPESGAWMRGGSYLVARPIRIALEHWDRMKLAFQEQTMGRQKHSGAPLGKAHEFEPLDLDASDADGNPVIPENAHVRLSAPASNGGAQILRRSFSYDNGLTYIAERWPPWRQAMEVDVGLLFVCYQRDPRTGFVKIFENMAKFDMMNQFVTHIGGGLFACPGGAAGPGHYVGQALLEAA